MSDLADVLRIVARHIAACADELDGETSSPDPAPTVADLKAQQAERHKRLGGIA